MADIYTPPNPNTKYEYDKYFTCRGFQLIHKWILLTGKHPELVGKIHELIETDPAVVNQKIKNGMTPLHLVCSDVGELDRVAMAKLLLEKGASIDANDEYHQTPLHFTADKDSADVAKLLLQNGANIDAKDGYQRTPLHWATMGDNVDVAKVLLENGAYVDAKDEDQRTPLHWAAITGCADVAKVLLEKGANVNAEDVDQQTPLHSATMRDNVDVAKVLLEKGANVNAEDVDQRTPLHLAADKDHADMAKLLLEKGANATLVGENKIITNALLSIENDKKNNELAQIGKILKEMYGLETKSEMDIIQTMKNMLEFSPEHPNVDRIGSHF